MSLRQSATAGKVAAQRLREPVVNAPAVELRLALPARGTPVGRLATQVNATKARLWWTSALCPSSDTDSAQAKPQSLDPVVGGASVLVDTAKQSERKRIRTSRQTQAGIGHLQFDHTYIQTPYHAIASPERTAASACLTFRGTAAEASCVTQLRYDRRADFLCMGGPTQ